MKRMGEVTSDLPARLGYAAALDASKPPAPPSGRGRTDEEYRAFAVWLWAMAQPFIGLTRPQAAELAESIGVRAAERPITPAGVIHGEMYSQPESIFMRVGDDGVVDAVAVENVWPNYWWPGWQDEG